MEVCLDNRTLIFIAVIIVLILYIIFTHVRNEGGGIRNFFKKSKPTASKSKQQSGEIESLISDIENSQLD